MVKRLTHKVWSFALASGCLALVGCEQESIRVYQAPKETARSASGHGDMGSAPSMVERPAPPARPKLTYDVPTGWSEAAPNQVSVANFTIVGADGKTANASIAPLPPLGNRETEVVNMWRQQMGLSEISPEEVGKLLTEVDVADTKGKLFELAGPSTAADGPQSIITVMQHTPETSWFYKISGDEALVTKEKSNFLAFIKSVRFDRSGSSASAPSAPATKASGWKIPGDWREVAPGAMQVAKFQVPPQKDATAEVTVSVFPSDTGGNLANVNRWRGQLKLNPVDESGLGKLVQPLDSQLPGAILVDMENQGDRMVGAIVPRGGQWYFYKLRGGPAAVEAQKAAFVAFARSEP